MAASSFSPAQGTKRAMTADLSADSDDIDGSLANKDCPKQQVCATDKKPISFLDLAFELREKIYRYYFAGDEKQGQRISRTFNGDEQSWAQDLCSLFVPENQDRQHVDIAMLQTCRTIYQEALPILHSTNSWTLIAEGVPAFNAMLSSIGYRNRVHIQHLQVQYVESRSPKQLRGLSYEIADCVNLKHLLVTPRPWEASLKLDKKAVIDATLDRPGVEATMKDRIL